MQYAICLSSQATASVSVFKFSRLSSTWTASLPSPQKFSKHVLSSSSKPRFLSSITVFILEARSIKSVLILYEGGYPPYYMIKETVLLFSIFYSPIYLIIYSSIYLFICLFMFFKIGYHSIAQYHLKFTIIPLPHPFKYWEYSNNLSFWCTEILLNENKFWNKYNIYLTFTIYNNTLHSSKFPVS